MTDVPNFGELLAPFLSKVPQPSVPAFLCELERTAAERYREWSEQCEPDQREGLLACAAREDEIADRMLAALPPAESDRGAIEAVLPGARDLYRSVFDDLPLKEQWRMQADAELQGAAAWRGIAAGQRDPALCSALEAVAKLEEESSEYLVSLLTE